MSGSITITNFTSSPIQITTVQDSSVVEGEREKNYTIQAKEYFTLFTDRVESIHWQKNKV